jgi:hypothetical protein
MIGAGGPAPRSASRPGGVLRGAGAVSAPGSSSSVPTDAASSGASATPSSRRSSIPSGLRAVAASDCSTTASSSRRLPGHGYSRTNASASALNPRGASRRACAHAAAMPAAIGSIRSTRSRSAGSRISIVASARASPVSSAGAFASRLASQRSVGARTPGGGPESSQIASSRCARGASAPTSSSHTERLGRRGWLRPSSNKTRSISSTSVSALHGTCASAPSPVPPK